jgi:hypothetical protein
MNYFEKLNNVNVNDKTDERSGLTFLAWAYAWGELKKLYPMSFYTIYENAEGLFYHTDGKTCWVKTGVTVVDGELKLEHIEYLPVMDYRNKSILVDSVTSFDVNKAIQRSLTKAVARHGLGLYIYAGEDLPEAEKAQETPLKKPKTPPVEPTKVTVIQPKELRKRNSELKQLLEDKGKTREEYNAIAGDRTVGAMSPDEYTAWFNDLNKRWS